MSRDVLLLFGGLPDEYLQEWKITSNLTLAEKKLDVQFVEIATNHLIARSLNLTVEESGEAEQISDQLVNNVDQNSQGSLPTVAEIRKAAELYMAIKAYIDQHDATAVTVVCGPWIREPDLPTPCIALMLLGEEGVPAACQGDIDALLTMVFFKRAAGVVSCMGNNFEADGELGVSHCVLPRNLCDPDGLLQPYYIDDYHGRKSSPTIHVQVPPGRLVTIARLTRNLETLILSKGRVVDNLDLQNRCRNTLVIQVQDSERVLRAMKGLQQHLVVACGDHTEEMSMLAKRSGIRVVAV